MRLLHILHCGVFYALVAGTISSTTAAGTTASPRDLFLRQILNNSEYPSYSSTPTPDGVPLKVGIIGAGAAGLYAAVLLDSLGIDYDILEASDRVGGRIFTYRFNQTAWDASNPSQPDYYDYYVSDRGFKTIPLND